MHDELAQSGYERDLQLAEIALLASGNDPAAYAKALRDYFAAHRNYTQGAMVPMFVSMVERALDTKLQPVVLGIGGLQLGVAQLNTGFQALSKTVGQLVLDMADSKADRKLLHDELHSVQAAIATIRAQLAEIRGTYSDEERARLTALLLRMIKDYETSIDADTNT